MNIALCEYADKKQFNAGNKARTDALSIAVSAGYKHIPLFRNGVSKLLIPFQLLRGMILTLFYAKRNDTVFVQYPYYPYFVNLLIFTLLGIGRRLKGYKTTVLIHDIINLRTKSTDSIENNPALKKELNALYAHFDKIICHNKKMKDVFNRICGESDKFTILGPFDYICHDKSVTCNFDNKDVKIVIAGNLSKNKSGYLYKLPQLENISFNLYGVEYANREYDYIHYKGVFPPDELIRHLEGNFGLVWDGNETNTCSGATGNYLRYNNPHKFSLYIAAGLPLIVWKDSALADYVEEKEIGLCINSIDDLKDILYSLDGRRYGIMLANVLKTRIEIINGEHLKSNL